MIKSTTQLTMTNPFDHNNCRFSIFVALSIIGIYNCLNLPKKLFIIQNKEIYQFFFCFYSHSICTHLNSLHNHLHTVVVLCSPSMNFTL